MTTVINFEKKIAARDCGGCTLCCRLVPVRELDKPAGERCRHQRTGKGCAVYQRAGFPMSCRFWSCAWLTGDDTADLRRPDRSRYVIDPMPDYVTLVNDETGARSPLEVVQIWCDPKFPDAWKDPALLDFIERRGREGKAAIVRYSQSGGVGVFPPGTTDNGQWHYKNLDPGKIDPQPHDFLQVARVLSGQQRQADRLVMPAAWVPRPPP